MNCQKPSKQQLLNTINEVSFAVNDIHLYLDTHPNDAKALAYFHSKSKIRSAALEEYAKYYGPLTIDTADDAHSQSWEWVTQPWPWEGKGGCC